MRFEKYIIEKDEIISKIAVEAGVQFLPKRMLILSFHLLHISE
jgi:hypothetical protein